jgi:hypothetical protein
VNGIGVIAPASPGVCIQGGATGSLTPDDLLANWATEDDGDLLTEDGGLWLTD